MSNEHQQPDSLAAQAAAWVPPWEREQRPPDRAYQAAAEAEARAELAGSDDDRAAADDLDDLDEREAESEGGAGERTPVARDDDEDRSEAGLSDDDDDFDEAFEGANPAGYGAVRADSPAEDEEPRGVDAPAVSDASAAGAPGGVDEPAEDGRDRGATEVESGPEVPLPGPIEEAAGAGGADDGVPVDAPLPPDGDDAGDVFDAAADDDVSDDDEVDLPIHEDEATGETTEDADEVTTAAAGGGNHGDAATAGDGRKSEGAQRGPGQSVPVQARGSRGGAVAVEDVGGRTSDVEPMDESELTAALEAILLVVDEPVAEMQLAQILEQPTERIAATLEDISARYTAAGHGFDLRRAAGGWRLYTRPEYAAYVERFVLDGQSVRLTQAALETLAVVAYKQPVTRSRISAIRGVNCDGVMRTLVTRGLIEECGTEGETGAYLYRTTALFLEKLGLNSVDQLPPLAPFLPDDVEEVLDAPG